MAPRMAYISSSVVQVLGAVKSAEISLKDIRFSSVESLAYDQQMCQNCRRSDAISNVL